MSTNDVPGANPANGDALKMGCWAEATDGSLIFVESTEGGRVIYSVFDLADNRVIEYRDALNEQDFKDRFTTPPQGSSRIVWTWHDKTAFPWDRVIKNGARDGGRLASAQDMIDQGQDVAASRQRITSAAEQVATDRNLTGREAIEAALRQRAQQFGGFDRQTVSKLVTGIKKLLDDTFGAGDHNA